MKVFSIFCFLALVRLMGFLTDKHTSVSAITVCHGKCVGSAYCTACSTCEYCKYCNSGGTCGVCAPSKTPKPASSSAYESITGKTSSYNSGGTTITTTLRFRVVSAKAYFYKSPDKRTIQKRFLIMGDTGVVMHKSTNFIYTEFVNSKGIITRGWLKLEDIALE